MRLLPLLAAYHRAHRLRFTSRQALECYQQQQLQRFFERTLSRSPYFSGYLKKPFTEWPQMDKALMMQEFSRMNTAGLNRDEAMVLVLRAEQSRDFSPTINGISIGLSSGTSGMRGLFAVSPREQAVWAGIMLAKMLPNGLLSGERVALFLRAGSNLYQAVRTPCLSFAYYDLFRPFADLLAEAERQQPSIVVAPAQVLAALAAAVRAGRLKLAPKKVVSAAEVLGAAEREFIQSVFPNLHEVYQATEGFLAATCAHGRLHLNEEFVCFEREWLDDERFVPVITDFTRQTQPIVRYRLNDVLAVSREPCPCGSACTVLSRIEGRCDDALVFGQKTLFADAVSRAIAQILPWNVDYRLTQERHILTLQAALPAEQWQAFTAHLNAFFAAQGVPAAGLEWRLDARAPEQDFTKKRRRIVCVEGK
ncbi:CoF synthetase [Eikenella sp. S3360]|uniref:CoF synthetase n=1 Tax=Eikenella glucosivorans TaxID=2766967 RepID=A0ABS0N9B0_9NEIS|nr:F390 synthetase-related protein [Eikenella glucosivorans]MBH5328898.1 CoF synthetase [Eikenella glucosivorans]